MENINGNGSSRWSVEEYKSLELIKNSIISSLKNISCDIFMDRIAYVQDRFYRALSCLDDWHNLLLKRTGTKETQDIAPRIKAVVDSMADQVIWERVYGRTDDVAGLSYGKGKKSLQQIRESIRDSLKQIEFDVLKDDVAALDGRLSSALTYLYEWRKLLPEKARPITTYWE